MTPKTVLLLLFLVPLTGCVDELPGFEGQPQAHDHAMQGEGADHGERADHGHDGHGHGGHSQSGMERPGFGQAMGKVPTADEAADFDQVSSLRIVGDDGFRPAAGVRSGNGTLDDPFIIEHWYVAGDLYIQDTDACFEVREVYVGGQLSLNWNGICTWVHHSYIHDLRVNENIRRDGYATGGYLEHNEIGYVGQLRHYDGVFRFNEVGPMPATAPYDEVLETVPFAFAKDPRIANIDGFNQGRIEHNTFHGSVDLDFHGHHHGTGFFASHSHYHGDNETRKMPHDHTERWTSVVFADNRIIDPEGYGLRYDDRNHAGDDRVAASEQEKTLSEDHFHRTDIQILRNTVEGSGIWIDIFNADDPHHDARNDGALTVQDNRIELVERDAGPFGLWGPGHAWHVGLRVFTAKEAHIDLVGNTLTFEARGEQGVLSVLDPVIVPVAIEIDGIRDAHVRIDDTEASGFEIGVRAARFDEQATWSLRGNDWGQATPMDADDSVPMPE